MKMPALNALDQLITADEVLEVVPQKRTMDQGNFNPMIRVKEEGLFRAWLGFDFYCELVADLYKPASVVEFVQGTVYSVGDVVRHHEKLFTLLVVNTGVEYPNPAQNTTYWEVTKKFSTPANNFLWHRYLKLVVGWHIFHSSVIYSAIQSNNLGVSSHADATSKPANTKALSLFKQEIGGDLNAFLLTMHQYMDGNADYPTYAPNVSTSNVSPGRKRRYHGFTGFDEELC